jgi:hypothetical protein
MPTATARRSKRCLPSLTIRISATTRRPSSDGRCVTFAFEPVSLGVSARLLCALAHVMYRLCLTQTRRLSLFVSFSLAVSCHQQVPPLEYIYKFVKAVSDCAQFSAECNIISLVRVERSVIHCLPVCLHALTVRGGIRLLNRDTRKFDCFHARVLRTCDRCRCN